MRYFTVWMSPLGDLILLGPTGMQYKVNRYGRGWEVTFSYEYSIFYKEYLKKLGYKELSKL